MAICINIQGLQYVCTTRTGAAHTTYSIGKLNNYYANCENMAIDSCSWTFKKYHNLSSQLASYIVDTRIGVATTLMRHKCVKAVHLCSCSEEFQDYSYVLATNSYIYGLHFKRVLNMCIQLCPSPVTAPLEQNEVCTPVNAKLFL